MAEPQGTAGEPVMVMALPAPDPDAPEEKYTLEKADDPEDEYSDPSIELRLTDEQKKMLTDSIFQFVSDCEADKERKAFIKKVKWALKRYSQEDMATNDPWEGCSARRTGGTTIATDRLIPRLKRAIFRTGNIIKVVAEGNTPEDIATKQEDWLDYVLRVVMDIVHKGANAIFDAVLLNFGAIKITWDREETERKTRTTYERPEELIRNFRTAAARYTKFFMRLVKGEKLTLTETRNICKQGCKAEWVRPENLYYPPGCTDEKKAWCIVEKLSMTRDEIMREHKRGYFKFNKDEFFGDPQKDKDGNAIAEDLGKPYEVLEFKRDYDIKGDGISIPTLIWVASNGSGKRFYFRGIEYPYEHGMPHWVILRTDHTRAGFYTGGLYDKLKAASDTADRILNAKINGWEQAVVKAWLRQRVPGAAFDPDIQEYYPGAVLEAAPGELSVLETGDIPASTFGIEQESQRDTQLLSGIPFDPMSGNPQVGDKGASGRKTELLLAESNISTGEYLANLVVGFEDIARQVHKNYHQFTDSSKIEYQRQTGMDKITKAEMGAETRFHLTSAINSVMSEQRAQSTLQLLGALGQHPLVANNWPLQAVMVKTIIENWSEDMAKVADKVITPEITAQIIDQLDKAQALAQEQAAMEGAIQQAVDQGIPRQQAELMVKQKAQQGQPGAAPGGSQMMPGQPQGMMA